MSQCNQRTRGAALRGRNPGMGRARGEVAMLTNDSSLILTHTCAAQRDSRRRLRPLRRALAFRHGLWVDFAAVRPSMAGCYVAYTLRVVGIPSSSPLTCSPPLFALPRLSAGDQTSQSPVVQSSCVLVTICVGPLITSSSAPSAPQKPARQTMRRRSG